jgi:photosystem II stability/assembly factor-like uncharacterized protein
VAAASLNETSAIDFARWDAGLDTLTTMGNACGRSLGTHAYRLALLAAGALGCGSVAAGGLVDAGNGGDAATPPGHGDASAGDFDSGASSPGHVVTPCAGLTDVGQWQNISPAAFTSPPNLEVLAVAVNPQDATVYAAAGNVTNGGACPAGMTCPSAGTGVYKSSDCGATWARVSDTTPGTDSANLLSGDPWAMLIDPVEPQTMYINNGYGNGPTIYKSVDGGVHWTSLDPDPEKVVGTGLPFVQAIAIDPYDDQHLAVTFHANCASPYNPWCFSQSSDGGSTWKEFNGPTSVPGFMITGWMESSSISILGPSSYIVLSPGGVHFTSDGGKTWTLVLAEIDNASYAGSTHILPDGTLTIGDTAGPLYYSAPAPGQSPPFALYQAPTLPVPQPRLPFQTGLSPAVLPLSNSPQGVEIIDDGVSLFVSTGEKQPFWRAPLSGTTSWTQMPDAICTGSVCRGSNQLAYDAAHHVVYSANWGAGLWRLVTR